MTVDFNVTIEDTQFDTDLGIHGFIGSLKAFAEEHGAKLVDVDVTVDGQPNAGTCESCGLPILPGEPCAEDLEGVKWHASACPLDGE